jgi:BirA family transcriptional regulator, biotin operon repressor / biotin---[acetyl-CoA-carboxylase] ligase
MPYKPVLSPPLNLVELPTVGSTNDHARQLARNGYPSGVVVWAHEQTAGRGRQGNSWTSFPGNLFMSMLLRPKVNAAQIGQISLLAAVALANILEPLLPAGADIRLKWPNDILINGKKAAGILIETESHGLLQSPWVVIGIGVNIAGAPENAVSLHALEVKEQEAGHILELAAAEIMKLVGQWEREGFEPVREAWMKRAHRLGEEIVARLATETVSGTFEGLDRTGALVLVLADGCRRLVASGEVFAEA